VPLVIHLRKGQQAIVNGAVLENVTGRTVSLAVKNEAKVLRSDDVLDPSSAQTPASRVYYALQCAYLFPDRGAVHLRAFEDFLQSYLAAAPSAAPIAATILTAIDAGNLYAALKSAQTLITHERKVLSHVETRVAEGIHGFTSGGQSADDGSLGLHAGSAAPEDE
jgi:flagellar protein FlbT